MNYRHAFHAGNFADILKHVALLRVLEHLKSKDTPFRVIDTHAGAGLYDLGGPEAARTGEWIEGIGRLKGVSLGKEAETVLAPYRAAIAHISQIHGSDGHIYPGSPALIQMSLRADDRASFNELHGETAHHLRRAIGRDRRIVINEIDGYTAWKAQIPPRERRGLVLVDPPFEKDDEFARLGEYACEMGRKWPTGIGIFWYPIKNLRAVFIFEQALAASAFPKVMIAELHVDTSRDSGPLAACGIAIVNPPWKLGQELTILLPELSNLLARGGTARWRVDQLKGE